MACAPTFLICSSLSSSSRKKVRYMKDTSTSQLPPNSLCSSMVSLPPENACLLTCTSKSRDASWFRPPRVCKLAAS